MGVRPEGEAIKKAVQWVGEERKANPDRDLNQLVEEASRKYDLSPADADFLFRMVHAE